MTDEARLRLVSAIACLDFCQQCLQQWNVDSGTMALQSTLEDLDSPACESVDPDVLRGFADAVLNHLGTAKVLGGDAAHILSMTERAATFRVKLIARGARTG